MYSCTRYVLDKATEGEIKSTHINDIIKTYLHNSASDLSPDAQMSLVTHIIAERNQISIRNSEHSSTLLVKEGSEVEHNLGNWVSNILRLVSELNECLNIEQCCYSNLSSEQKMYVSQELYDLKCSIESKLFWVE